MWGSPGCAGAGSDGDDRTPALWDVSSARVPGRGLTSDGRADIAVGARWAALGGYVKLFDGPTGAVLDRQQADADFECSAARWPSPTAAPAASDGWPPARTRATRGRPTPEATSASGSTDRRIDARP